MVLLAAVWVVFRVVIGTAVVSSAMSNEQSGRLCDVSSARPTVALEEKPDTTLALQRARAVIAIERDALQELHDRLDASFVEALTVMEAATGRIIVTGMGKSGHIGRKIAATLASVGTPATFLHPAEGSHGDLGVVMPGDVVLAISNSGETQELLDILPTLKRLGIPLIAMTGYRHSSLASRSDVVLDISVQQEACPLGLAPTSSTTVTLALGDALALVLLERKGFTSEDFALFHPAGSLGKRLLLQVRDVMHAGEQLPVCTTATPLLDALVEMTSKQLGMTLVLDLHGQLSGIVTDGDVRRALQRFADVRTVTVEHVMSMNPRTISPSALAAKAMYEMEQRSISCLVVTDELSSKPIGVVHLHDLLKAGLR